MIQVIAETELRTLTEKVISRTNQMHFLSQMAISQETLKHTTLGGLLVLGIK